MSWIDMAAQLRFWMAQGMVCLAMGGNYIVHVRRTNGDKEVYESTDAADHDVALTDVLDQLDPETIRVALTLVKPQQKEEKEVA